MDQLSLDDQLKQAQIDKTHAETKKLEREAEVVTTNVKSEFWSEAIKILGGVVLGIGGVIVAYTQYEVSELKATMAEEHLAKAQDEQAKAEAEANEAVAKRDAALRERKEAEAAVAELRTSLTQMNNALKTADPNEVKGRLTYIQFRGDLTRDIINELRNDLKKKAFNAPGAERVAGDYPNLVKYFNPNENKDAEELAAAVEAFFTSKGCPLRMRVVPTSSTAAKNPPLEVWIAHKCTK